MAKKLWTLDLDNGTLTREYQDGVKELELDMANLFEDFLDYEVVQQMTIVNGVKQKIADTVATSKDMKLTEGEKRERQETLWTRMTVEREWNLPSAGRVPGISYKKLIPGLREQGMSDETIAEFLSVDEDVVAQF